MPKGAPSTKAEPVPFQLAIQGGGAKLVRLLAALDAVQELEDEKVLRITRLSGTSAGSIAAALFAAEIPMSAIRQRLKDNRQAILKAFPTPGLMALLRALNGGTMLDIGNVRRVLSDEFRRHKINTFGDLKRDLIVVATDVTNGQSVPVTGPETPLVNTLLDSSAIPFVFRGPGKPDGNALLVDGGICENLPSEFLTPFKEKDGEIIGLTFQPGPPGTTPTSVPGLAWALLETAMNHSVRRAQRLVGDTMLLKLKADIGTIDFARALDEAGLDSGWDAAKAEALAFFHQRVAEARSDAGVARTVVEAGPDTEQSPEQLQHVADLYRVLSTSIRMKFEEVRMVVRIGALTKGEDGVPTPDYVRYRLRFSAAKEPLPAALISLTGPTGEVQRTERYEVFDGQGNPWRTVDLVGRHKKRPQERLYVLFLDPQLRAGDPAAPLTLGYTHSAQDLMSPLREAGADVICLQTIRADGPTPRITLIALIPEAFPGIRIRSSSDTTGSVQGREMTKGELNKLELDPEGHYLLGWIGENVEANQTFAAELYQPNFMPPSQLS